MDASRPSCRLPASLRAGGGAPIAALTAALIALLTPALARAQIPSEAPSPPREDLRCLDCHGQPHIAELNPAERLSMVGTWLDTTTPSPDRPAPATWGLRGDEPATRPELYVTADALAGSAHDGVTCVECHEDAAQLPHEPRLNTETCAATCHALEATEYPTGSHAEARQRNDPLAPTCASCHGGHQILPVGNRQSPQHRLNSIFLCATCHEQHMRETPGGYEPRSHIEAYLHSAHGKAVAESGLVAAPTCADCHGAHGVHPVEHPLSPVHRDTIADTCGGCHVGILNIYEASIHGQKFAEGNHEAPVCTDCHTSHEIIQPDEVAFKLASGERCGACHEDRIKHYQETFHGKALALGLSNVAACFDCHGHHDIVPIDDPSSRLAGDAKLETCRQCHPSAGPMFTGYIAHANHLDRELYPVLYWTFVAMTALVIGTFIFFGMHTILWFVRSLMLYVRDREKFRAIKRQMQQDKETYVRFRPFDRFLHILVMSSFLLLVATGMPLKFYYTDWAKQVVRHIGGLEAAAQLHRLGAIITFTYFALHIGSLVRAGIRNRDQFRNPETGRFSPRRLIKVMFGPDLPYPHIQDLKDFWAHQKWFFGRGPQPSFDKWTYWEKFDYMAVFWGVTVIGLSGLIMWFPEFFTRFLPGWLINVALIVHSDEALL
ncbi:MAG: cytochrome b/b6 domain-containing protein, partial [Phycisphaerales bacterium JB039]